MPRNQWSDEVKAKFASEYFRLEKEYPKQTFRERVTQAQKVLPREIHKTYFTTERQLPWLRRILKHVKSRSNGGSDTVSSSERREVPQALTKSQLSDVLSKKGRASGEAVDAFVPTEKERKFLSELPIKAFAWEIRRRIEEHARRARELQEGLNSISAVISDVPMPDSGFDELSVSVRRRSVRKTEELSEGRSVRRLSPSFTDPRSRRLAAGVVEKDGGELDETDDSPDDGDDDGGDDSDDGESDGDEDEFNRPSPRGSPSRALPFDYVAGAQTTGDGSAYRPAYPLLKGKVGLTRLAEDAHKETPAQKLPSLSTATNVLIYGLDDEQSSLVLEMVGKEFCPHTNVQTKTSAVDPDDYDIVLMGPGCTRMEEAAALRLSQNKVVWASGDNFDEFLIRIRETLNDAKQKS